MAGKGDKPRPVNKKLYNNNFDKINWEPIKKENKNIITRKNKIIIIYK